MHPERKGQPAGPIDWEVAALNAIGLLFFFVPGVIAFAVDFNNGTIYLPSENFIDINSPSKEAELVTVDIPQRDLNRPGIEQAVSARSERSVSLEPGEYHTKPLSDAEEFWPTHNDFSSRW